MESEGISALQLKPSQFSTSETRIYPSKGTSQIGVGLFSYLPRGAFINSMSGKRGARRMPLFWSPWQDLQCQDLPEQPENLGRNLKNKIISSLSNIHTQKKT